MNVFLAVCLSVMIACASAAQGGDDVRFSPGQIKTGATLFARHCATWHGTRMRNPQRAIDLRQFPRDAHARFVDSVSNGKRNMPPWDDVLSTDEIEALWAYVVAGEAAD